MRRQIDIAWNSMGHNRAAQAVAQSKYLMSFLSISVQVEIVGNSPGANTQPRDHALNAVQMCMIHLGDRSQSSNDWKRALTSSPLHSANSIAKPIERSLDKPARSLRRLIPTVEGNLQER